MWLNLLYIVLWGLTLMRLGQSYFLGKTLIIFTFSQVLRSQAAAGLLLRQ